MLEKDNIKLATDANRKVWDISAKHHRSSNLWKETVATIGQPNFSCFDPTMTAALKKMNLSKKSAVQIGCNNGRELLSLHAFGITKSLGIDQSQEFIAQAHELNHIAQKPTDFISANIYNLPPETPKDFDLALITIGVLSWMPDLPTFFNVIASLLNETGQLIIYETHPFLEQFEPNSKTPYKPAYSYFKTDPFIEEEIITYDGTQHHGGAVSYWYIHTLSHIFTCIMGAGFQISGFDEFAHSNREVDYSIYENQTAQLPMCYVLQAKKV